MSHETCKTVRVESWSISQGEFVEINESDFDPNKHKLYKGKTPTAPPPAAASLEPVADVKIQAKAAKLAEELGIADPGKIKGSGKNGAVTVADVEAFAQMTGAIDFASDEAAELAFARLDIEWSEIAGTGDDGALTVADVKAAIEK